jgi:putative zinc finger/helix-turn-helix YgiT family protein
MTTLKNCPFCEGVRLTEQDEIAEFNDRKNGVRLQYYKSLTSCLDCGERFEIPSQRAENSKRIAEARSVARGAPTAAEILALRKKWGLTIADAGALFGGGEIAFAKYEKGEIVPVQSMSKLLRLAIAGVIDQESLRELNSGAATNMQARSGRASLALVKPTESRDISPLKSPMPITLIDREKDKSFAVGDMTYVASEFSFTQPSADSSGRRFLVLNFVGMDNVVDTQAQTSTFSEVVYEASTEKRRVSAAKGQSK